MRGLVLGKKNESKQMDCFVITLALSSVAMHRLGEGAKAFTEQMDYLLEVLSRGGLPVQAGGQNGASTLGWQENIVKVGRH